MLSYDRPLSLFIRLRWNTLWILECCKLKIQAIFKQDNKDIGSNNSNPEFTCKMVIFRVCFILYFAGLSAGKRFWTFWVDLNSMLALYAEIKRAD